MKIVAHRALPLLVVVVALVVGVGAAVARQRVDPAPAPASAASRPVGLHASRTPPGCQPGTPTAAETAFVEGMAAHHRQAVTMAAILRSRPDVPYRVRNFADQIATTQKLEIGDMDTWLAAWRRALTHSACHPAGGGGPMAGMGGGSGGGAGRGHLMPGMLTAAQVESLRGPGGVREARLFVRLMIQHHEGAVTMSRPILDNAATGNSWVVSLARHVIGHQASEIGAMRRMLNEL